MGGTWDATNVADGAVAVVTPIALDHTRYLGDTVEEIAAEKAGIIKPGAVAVLAQQPLGRRRGAAAARRPRWARPSPGRASSSASSRASSPSAARCSPCGGWPGDYHDLFLPLFGAHQAEQRRLRARRGGGVPRRAGDGAGRGPGRGRRSRTMTLAGPAGGRAAQPDGDRRRRAQPGRHGGQPGGADRGVLLHAADRGPRGQRGQGRAGDPGPAGAGRRRARGDAQLLDRGRWTPAKLAELAGGSLRAGPGAGRGPARRRDRDRASGWPTRRTGRRPGRHRCADHRLGDHRGRRAGAARRAEPGGRPGRRPNEAAVRHRADHGGDRDRAGHPGRASPSSTRPRVRPALAGGVLAAAAVLLRRARRRAAAGRWRAAACCRWW